MKLINKQKKLAVVLSSVVFAVALSSCNSNAGKSNGSGFAALGGTGHKANITEKHWHYTYNNMKLLETATDPNGNVTRYDYDGQGNISKVTNPLKQTIQFLDYTEDGNPQTIIDQNGVTTKMTYTIDGWLSSAVTDGAETRFDYNAVGDITKVTLPDGSYLEYGYDDARRLVRISNLDGSVQYTLDNAGNKIATKIEGNASNCGRLGCVGYQDQRTYDEINRLLKITTAISTQSFSYDNDDNLQTATDGRNNKISYAYDALQRLNQVTDAKSGNTKYDYDNSQNTDYPVSITDAKGTNTLYQYNGLGNLLKLTSPDSGNHNYTAYDGNGNLLQQQDARGNSISYDYDGLDRPKTITYADSIDNTNFTYDNGSNAVGRLTKVQNGVSSNSYYYDARGNTLSEVQRINNTDYTVRYAYDKADHLTNIVYPSTTQVVYTYTNGQISKVTINGKSLADIKHLAFGPISQIAFTNGVSEDIAYNSDYSIKQLKLSNDLINREYSYYPNGQIKAISGVGEYDYDQLGALTKAESNSYDYDKVSNRTNGTVNGSKTDYTIEGTSNRLLSSTFSSITSDYKYDTSGNIIKAGDKNYSYDSLNRLKSVTQDSNLTDKQLATYQYNSFSQRIMKDVDGNKTIFLYNSAGQLLEEINKAQNVTKDYVYADGQLIAIAENGQVLYIVADHLNAPQIAMDSTGRSIWSAKYNEFGKATIISNYKLNIRADGQYQDDETGLYYNWYRYYDANLGRYITSDPLGLQAGMNTYVYVNGNPINYTDPQGLCPWCVAAGVVAVGMAEGAAFGAGTEIIIQAAQHKTNFGAYDKKAIGYAALYGTIPGVAGAYMAKRSVGVAGMIVTDAISNGFAAGLQTSVDNYCSNKDVLGENMTWDQLYGTSMGALGSSIYHGIVHSSNSKYGGLVGEVFSNGAQGVIEYNKRENNKQ